MKKKLISLLMAIVIVLSMSSTALAAYTPEESLERISTVLAYAAYYGLEDISEYDLLVRGLENAFELKTGDYNGIMANIERYTGVKNPGGATREDALSAAVYQMLSLRPECTDELANAILSSIDAFSMYLPAGTYDTAFPENQNFTGVGVVVVKVSTGLKITEVTVGSPAEKAGLRVDDILTHVDGTSLAPLSLYEGAALLAGNAGTSVKLAFTRFGHTMNVTVTRAEIIVPNLTHRTLENGIYYIDLDSFMDETTYRHFEAALEGMKAQQTDVLILDLRGNTGGELEMVMSFINRLVPEKWVPYFNVISKDTTGEIDTHTYRSNGLGRKLEKIIILCDDYSASASEVMIAALSDLNLAVTVGTPTYGKACGQSHIVFDDGAAAVFTTVKLQRISGVDYQGSGISPTHEVKNKITKHPAASVKALDFTYLSYGDSSQKAQKLCAALKALGYLPSSHKGTSFDSAALKAMNALRADVGLGSLSSLNKETVTLINNGLKQYADTEIVVDSQFDYALNLARSYAKKAS